MIDAHLVDEVGVGAYRIRSLVRHAMHVDSDVPSEVPWGPAAETVPRVEVAVSGRGGRG
ncbi:hypothetical protein V5P93_004645 [Actinokineospora auranticolor]|uniref:Uncharacterized protein n=1 Tax=Actinokineospora auranticolor TaxID=155976 RepID=A0A2S6GBN2_9PSEU|nr:hypothetical protein [Actinokineospora auranticolor]PPK61467.1 hypothetical protein CLV40_14117 [Actinokineospora auranticolor]